MLNFKTLMSVYIFLLAGLVGLYAQPQVQFPNTQSKFEQALELFQKDQFGNAQSLFDALSADHTIPEKERASSEFHSALCAIALYNGDSEDRVERFARSYELSPLKNELYLAYANYRFSLRRYSDAEEFYNKVDAYALSGEELEEFQFKKGYSLLMQERNEEASKLFFKLKDKKSSYAKSSRYYYAHLLYADSNYTEALTNFLPLQEDASFGPLVPYYLAHIYYRLGDYDKLLEVGKDLVENATPGRAPEIAKLVGDAFYQKGDFKSAIAYLELYKEKGGRVSLRDQFQMGYSYYKLGNYAAAIQAFNKITNGSDDIKQSAYYHLGDCYLKTGEKRQAMTAFKAASEISYSQTVQEDAAFNYAKLAYELNDPYQDAISTMLSFLDQYPNSPNTNDINSYLANLYITSKDYEKAMLALKRVGLNDVRTKAAYQKIAFYRGAELYKSLKYAAAITKFEESLKYPFNSTFKTLAFYWIGEAHYAMNNYEAALKHLEAFRNSNGAYNMSEYQNSLYTSGYAHYKLFNFQAAAEELRRFTREAKSNNKRLPDAYLRLGDSYLLTGGYLVAADFYQKALDKSTQQADYALFQRAECLKLAGKPQDQIALLEQLIKRYPTSTFSQEAQYEIPSTQLQIESYSAALTGFNEYIGKYPQSSRVPSAALKIGLAYSNTDQNAMAIDQFKKVAREYPGTDESYEAIGLARLVFARTNNIDGYLDWVETLDYVDIDKSTLDSTAYASAFEQYSLSDCKEAIKGFENYITRFEKGIFKLKAQYYLAECAEKEGEQAKAVKAWKAITAMPLNEYTVKSLHSLADYQFEQKNYGNAVDNYKKLSQTAQDKNHIMASQYGLMRAFDALGDYKNASEYANVVLGATDLEESKKREALAIGMRSNMQLKDEEQASVFIESLIAQAKGEILAEAYYSKAVILQNQSDYDSSNAVVYKMIEVLPSFKEWKLKGLLVIARNYWKQGDEFQANYTLDFILSSSPDEVLEQKAKDIKEQIKNPPAAKKANPASTEVPANNKGIRLNTNSDIMLIDESEEPVELENKED